MEPKTITSILLFILSKTFRFKETFLFLKHTSPIDIRNNVCVTSLEPYLNNKMQMSKLISYI